MMTGRRRLGVVPAALFAILMTGGQGVLEAQETVSSRFRVLVPDLLAMNGENKKFGEKLAEELRELISDLNTHTAVSKKEIKKAAGRFKLKMRDLDCIRSRQLAQQSNYQIVLCAQYSGTPAAYEILNIKFVDTDSGTEFTVDPVQSAEKQEAVAAKEIVDRFALFVEQSRRAVFCGQYAQSQNWESALDNCDRALELNPNANAVRYTRADVLRWMERYQESLDEVKQLLQNDPLHGNALLLGGFVAMKVADRPQAREFYRKYLELDPTNAAVRMTVAYDLAKEGDPLGGMELIEEGVARDPDNIDFHEQLGSFAFAAAEQVNKETEGTEDGVSPEVAELYRKAIASYEKVFEVKGAETLVTQLRNVAAAYIQLGQADEAADFAQRALQSHREEAGLWAIYAEALQQTDQTDAALEALRSIEGIDPDWPNLHLRMGNLLIEVGRVEEAVPILKHAVARGSAADQAANMIFSHAYGAYIQPNQKNYPRFIELISMAKEFEVSSQAREQYDFWHGLSLYNRGIAVQEPENIQSANRSLPIFQQALGLFRKSKGYADRTPSVNYQRFVDATGTYIEIQEAIIKRGR